MKKNTRFSGAVMLLFLLLSGPVFALPSAENMIKTADSLYLNGNFTDAYDIYEKALAAAKKADDKESVRHCRQRIINIEKIMMTYPYDKEQLKKEFQKQFKGFTLAELDSWIEKGMVDHLMINGKPYFFNSCLDNLKFRYPEIRKRFPETLKSDEDIAKSILGFINKDPGLGKPLAPHQHYINPKRFLATAEVNIPRKKLPKEGVLRLWIPCIVQIDSQRDIRFVEISPAEYLKSAPRISQDLGIAYFEIPLKELKTDLHARVQFTFNHYEQYFNVDPENVGEYDKESPLYRQFTVSDKNITITPEIKEKALQIVGDEKNPYLQAKLIYRYILKNIKYSYMPHSYLDTLNFSEAVFVHEHGYGDCGAQGIYFSALCRSIGIPARSPGGYQVWVENGGCHFWAECYIPNYGWIPNDTTIADAATVTDTITEARKEMIRDYYFGHQDSYRMVIQRDVDVMPYPPTNGPPFLSLAQQMPLAECDDTDVRVGILALEHFKMKIVPMD